MGNSRTSVVIPMLNETDNLGPLLESLEEQTYPPDEIIFVDAGSTDGSPDFVVDWWGRHAGKTSNRSVISQDGAYPGAARNSGIKMASSDWIAFLDCGIVPDRGWLEGLVRCNAEGHKAVFGVCDFAPKGNRIAKTICALSYGGKKVWNVVPASMIHRSVFEEIGGFREDLRSAEDIEWLSRFRIRYGPGVICGHARVTYSNFPETVREAVVKWFIYARNTARAAVLRKQQLILCMVWVILIAALFVEFRTAVVMLLAYAILRGICVPILRGGTKWVLGNPINLLSGLFLALILDLAKVCGFFTEYVANAKRMLTKNWILLGPTGF